MMHAVTGTQSALYHSSVLNWSSQRLRCSKRPGGSAEEVSRALSGSANKVPFETVQAHSSPVHISPLVVVADLSILAPIDRSNLELSYLSRGAQTTSGEAELKLHSTTHNVREDLRVASGGKSVKVRAVYRKECSSQDQMSEDGSLIRPSAMGVGV